jgi:hypothetical protein
VVFEDGTIHGDGSHDVVLARIDPSNGAKLGKTVLDNIDSERGFISADASFDGTSFTFASGTFDFEGFGFIERVGTVTGNTVLAAPAANEELVGSRIASLPDQRSLLLDQLQGRITVTPVNDAP